MITTTSVEVTTATGIAIGALDARLYVEALGPQPSDIRAVLDVLDVAGWSPIPEDVEEPEVTDRGVRIWMRRTDAELVRAR